MVVISWIILAFIVAAMGGDRRIGFWVALLVALIFSPLIGFIAVLLSPNNEKANAENAQESLAKTQEIETLFNLKEKGILTEEEFENKKKNLLK